jgi:hypothetical protein
MGGRFASGVFSSREKAEEWINKHQLTGVLTNYPLDTGVYEWALENDSFKVNREEKTQAKFIQHFSSASQEHYHYDPHNIG